MQDLPNIVTRLGLLEAQRIGVIATLPSTLQPTADLIRSRASAAGKNVELTTRVTPADHAAIATAARVLRDGGLVAFPTETVYGLGANALDGGAVARIFEAKGRPRDVRLPVLVGSTQQALSFTSGVRPEVFGLMERFWPGGLTIVLLRKPALTAEPGNGAGTVGLRCPDHRVPRALCETVGCRRVRLLSYFGEDSGPCGNCDTCASPPQAWDGTVAAQKFLSAAATFAAGSCTRVASPAAPWAPPSIQLLTSATCSAVRAPPCGGIFP